MDASNLGDRTDSRHLPFASPPPTFESAFYPYTETSPIINGVSKNSIYYKTIKRELGYFDIYC